MNVLLEPLLKSHQFVVYVDELQRLLAAERSRREQFYEDISPGDKWEFINGEVVMHSPATIKHLQVNERIHRLLKTNVDVHGLGAVHLEKALVSFTRNDYEPDIVFFSRSVAETLKPDQWKLPSPQMVVEVLSPSTREHDRGVKFEDYAAHLVDEYWIVDPAEETIEQYLLLDGAYRLEVKLRNGNVECRALIGFVLPVRAAFEDAANLQALWDLRPEAKS